MNKLRSTLILSLAVLVSRGSNAADSVYDRAAPEVQAQLKRLAEAYRSLPYYADHGVFTRKITLSGDVEGKRDLTESIPLTVTFARPNRLVLNAGDIRLFADGATFTTVLEPTKRYRSAPNPPRLSLTPIADGPAGAILLGGPLGPPSQLLLKLLFGSDPADILPDRASGVSAEKDELRDGVNFHRILIVQGDEPALRVWIDPTSQLIHSMEYVLDGSDVVGHAPSGSKLANLEMSWNAGQVATNEPATEVFGYKPPGDFSRIAAAEAKPVAAEPKSELIGKPSPDFAMNIFDGPGKTKRMTRDDLRGKVVVIDFWATWCGPCLQELPEVQAMAESYVKAKVDGLVVLAVSQDRAPEDGSNLREMVEKLLKTKSLELDRPPLSRVALDPEQTVGEAFKVEGIPTVVILDAKGIIQAVHVGYRDDVRERLTADIDALLAGKTLAPLAK